MLVFVQLFLQGDDLEPQALVELIGFASVHAYAVGGVRKARRM